jgi:hypothetical protein
MSSLLLLAVTLTATPGAPSVTVVVQGPRASATRAALAKTDWPFELRPADPPAAVVVQEQTSALHGALAAARRAYVSADFACCLTHLDADQLVPSLLSRGERTLAARVLAWRTACFSGANQESLAVAAAEALATLRLPLPEDVASMAPDVEALLARSATVVGTRALLPVTVTATPEGALVSVDGRPEGCATPCQVDLPPGLHVLRLSAEGHSLSWRAITASPGVAAQTFELAPATPEEAATQWQARRVNGASLDSEASMRLLSTSLRAPRLVLVASDAMTPERLEGALVVDGALAARAARQGDAVGLVKDLLVRGRVLEEAPPLYQRWPFWAAVGVAAVAAGVTSAVVVANHHTVTHVEFNP